MLMWIGFEPCGGTGWDGDYGNWYNRELVWQILVSSIA